MKNLNFWILIVSLIILLSILIGCTTQNKVSKFLKKNPEYSDEYFDLHYGCKDSVGQAHLDSIRKADNDSYAHIIDSISLASNILLNSLNKDMLTSNSEMIMAYKNDILKLRKQIKDFNDNYKPCKPDKYYYSITKYQDNIAKIRNLNNTIFSLKQENSFKEKELKSAKEDIRLINKKLNYRFWLIIGLCSLLVGMIFIRIKK